ncbi:MAG: MATE family efflux transporter [Geminicoccaceae bacterium]
MRSPAFAVGIARRWACRSAQIVINTIALIYMLAIGLATATAVRVGSAVGRRDRPGLAKAGWVGLGIGIAVMLALMPVLYGSSGLIVAVYTDDPAVAAIAGPDLALAAWLLAADASQGILTGALRGAADIWACILVRFFAFWLISIPVCYLLAHRWDLGIPGLPWGLLIGLSAAALLLAWRFKVLAGREVRPL